VIKLFLFVSKNQLKMIESLYLFPLKAVHTVQNVLMKKYEFLDCLNHSVLAYISAFLFWQLDVAFGALLETGKRQHFRFDSFCQLPETVSCRHMTNT